MPRKPPEIGSPKFLALQAKWYAKLKKLGYQDIERGMDMNQEPRTTMPHGHGSFLYDPESDELEQDSFIPLEDTDRAGFFREVGRKANQLPEDSRLYDLAMAYADSGSFEEAARETNTPYRHAVKMLGDWLQGHGLPRSAWSAKTKPEPPQEPAPCRVLTREEIALLNLQPPRRGRK